MQHVSVTLDNHRAWITKPSDELYERLRDFWAFFPPGFFFSPKYKLYIREKARAIEEGTTDQPIPGWDGKLRLYQRGSVPAGLFRATRKEAERELSIKFDTTKKYPKLKDLSTGLAPASEQYHYQNECVEAMVKMLPRGGCLVLACTGSGKTATASRFFAKVPYNCLFVVHRKNLMYQSQKEIASWLGEDVGIVGDSIFQPRRVTVATIQTLDLHSTKGKFQKWFRTVNIVIVDELHKQMAKRNFQLLEDINPLARYGLTATLQLKKKNVRYKAYSFAGPVGFEFPISEGVKQGVVTKGRALQLLFEETYNWELVDKSDYGKGNAFYNHQYQVEVLENETKIKACKAIVDYLISKDKYVIVLVERIDHIRALHEAFHTTPHRLAWGGVKKNRRESAQMKFEDGDVQLIIANGVFKDGINIKRVNAIIDMAEWQSKGDTVQKYGRGVRLHEDKEELLYIDIGTATGRFLKASKSRARALTQEGIAVAKAKAGTIQSAVAALIKFVEEKAK